MNTNEPGSDGGSRYTYVISVVISLLIVIVIVKLTRYILGPPKEEELASSVDGDDGVPPAEVALDVRAPGPVLCAYRRGDGWRESTCPVCLSDFADGETIRVLPACMHYFHAACVGEWLCGNDTCPLCRAAPPPASPAGSPAKATSTA
ncbi:hypothetical protein ACQ4PT_014658 [Festuca glaucescens]